MMFAAVDIGNSLVKVCHWNGDRFEISKKETIEAAVDELVKKGVGKVAYCSTRKIEEETASLIARAGWWEFDSDCRIPIRIEYESPAKLGRDRLAAAIGASSIYRGRNILIADLGTALTLDIVSADGVFKGGNISPGIKMRLESLHGYTSLLPEVGIEGETFPFGKDTFTAMRSGAVWGVVYEITGAYLRANKEYGCDSMVLTGGGGKIVFNKLLEELKVLKEKAPEVEVRENLVEEGLKIAYLYNHENKK